MIGLLKVYNVLLSFDSLCIKVNSLFKYDVSIWKMVWFVENFWPASGYLLLTLFLFWFSKIFWIEAAVYDIYIKKNTFDSFEYKLGMVFTLFSIFQILNKKQN